MWKNVTVVTGQSGACYSRRFSGSQPTVGVGSPIVGREISVVV